MVIIGIYDQHNSSVALSVDGEIICAVQEERFTKRKNETGFPRNAVRYVIDKYGLNDTNIDIVAMSTIQRTDINNLQYPTDAVFGVKEYIEMMEEYWKPKLSGKPYPKDYAKQFFEQHYPNEEVFYSIDDEFYELEPDALQAKMIEVTIKDVAAYVGVTEEKVKFYDHHTCHAMYAYFANPNKKETTIAVTVDAYGDKRNQTVWKIHKEKFELVSESAQCEIARIYRMITLYLRMKPLEHEFKVMGLAPYAKENYFAEIEKVFDDLLTFDGLNIVHKNRPANLYEYLCEKLRHYRFDNIAGAIQSYTEKMLIELFSRCEQEIGCRNFVFSGGVAMNVKANKVLGELECVDDLFVAGSSSDESQSIGACYFANYELGIENKSLEHLYLGTQNDDEEIEIFLKEKGMYDKYNIKVTTNQEIATLLYEGEVVARVVGRMEFGSRALGNRSILANPSNPGIVQYINELIKGRDFWMPFAATVLDKYQDRYLDNPKGYESRYMAVAMDTKKDYLKDIKAGTHPYDETIRPQILTKEQNEDYYDLIDSFAKLSGIGSLLNTSYNLHGLPMVSDINDAVHVFENSGLKYLVLNNYLIAKA